MSNVCLYARVSTHDQQTLPMHLPAMRLYARRRTKTTQCRSAPSDFKEVRHRVPLTGLIDKSIPTFDAIIGVFRDSRDLAATGRGFGRSDWLGRTDADVRDRQQRELPDSRRPLACLTIPFLR
jgi:hypothetical protein